MRRDKVVALPRRGAAQQQQRKARQGPPPAARAAADILAAHRGPRAIDEATYQDHAAKIRERFRVAVDCPDLTYLASRWGAGRFEHVSALRRIAPDFAVLLARQQAEREKFLHRPVPGMP